MVKARMNGLAGVSERKGQVQVLSSLGFGSVRYTREEGKC